MELKDVNSPQTLQQYLKQNPRELNTLHKMVDDEDFADEEQYKDLRRTLKTLISGIENFKNRDDKKNRKVVYKTAELADLFFDTSFEDVSSFFDAFEEKHSRNMGFMVTFFRNFIKNYLLKILKQN